jgi:hypothetical protein
MMKSFLAILLVSTSTGSLLQCPGNNSSSAADTQCGRCHSVDDPHISTFDGTAYDQHTDGCFKYVTECRRASRRAPVPFEICGCHGECGDRGDGGAGGPRCIGDVTISFFDSTGTTFNIEIEKSNPLIAFDTISTNTLSHGSVHIFDVASNHLFEYVQNANQHIFKINGGGTPSFYAYISYQIGYLEVFLDAAYFQQRNTCGLCGFFDSNPNNDFTGSDYALYVPPPLLPLSWPITTAVVDMINDFADTYLCADDDVTQCYEIARDCCELLWTNSIEAIWINEIVPADEFKEDWLLGCIVDACALTNNELTETCEPYGLQFAQKIATATATRTYP